MKNYEVIINEPASFSYIVEADDKEKAKEIAMETHSLTFYSLEPEFNFSGNAEIYDIIELEYETVEFLSVRIGSIMKEKFRRYCESQNKNFQDVINELISNTLKT